MTAKWTPDSVLETMRQYQLACVMGAGAELGVFNALSSKPPVSAAELAGAIEADVRALTVLLDALTAAELLIKKAGRYSLAPGAAESLSESAPSNVLAMVQHQANCLRRWSDLAWVVKTGRPAQRKPSVRGAEGDLSSFISAMDNVSAPVAGKLISEIGPLCFRHLLDVGGASGTWTLAWLKLYPEARATIFDLPEVIPMAQARVGKAGQLQRVSFAGGDYHRDELPAGADLVWLSAIVHQESRADNRKLFASIFRALEAGGKILIRDIVMDEERSTPVAGAMFAVNMLVGTESGGTFTMSELREDLEAAGFGGVELVRQDAAMNSVVSAVKE